MRRIFWTVIAVLVCGGITFGGPVTCTPSGTGNAGCQTDPNFPNTWFMLATGENEPGAEQTQTFTAVGATFSSYGFFEILDPTGSVSDTIQLTPALGGDNVIFNSDPGPGGVALPDISVVVLGTEGDSGIVVPLGINLVGGGTLTLVFGSDGESGFNPIGVASGADLTDFVQVAPEPSAWTFLAIGLALIAAVRSRRLRGA